MFKIPISAVASVLLLLCSTPVRTTEWVGRPRHSLHIQYCSIVLCMDKHVYIQYALAYIRITYVCIPLKCQGVRKTQVGGTWRFAVSTQSL